MTQDMGDIEALLDEMEPRKRPGKLDRWLDADPERGEKFWRFIDLGQARGLSIEDLLVKWGQHFDPCPVTSCRIRERLRGRDGRA